MNDQSEIKTIGDIEAVTVIGISFQHQLAPTKGLVFQTHIPSNACADEINGALDKLVDAAERQLARVSIPELERTIQVKQDFMVRAQEIMFRADKERELIRAQALSQWRGQGKRGEVKLSPSQLNDDKKTAAERADAEQNLGQTEKQLVEHRAELKRLKALIGE